jgi:2-keto-4-pentenoate hydratase/2-oxohepta-3-ene-1,7-dioic acid hydratase in catechol pathway
MRLARRVDGTPLLGDESGFVPLAAAAPSLETVADALAAASTGLPSLAAAAVSPTPADQLRFASPLPPRRKQWGIGLNYREHAADLAEDRPEAPASFLKPASALAAPGDPLRLPPASVTDRVTAEAELGVVVGRPCRDVDAGAFSGVVGGLVPVIDLTAEDILEHNPRFLTRAKSFDTFQAVGPWIETDVPGRDDLADVTVRTVVDGETVADNDVAAMAFGPADLVAYHSQSTLLETGDLISTGTPGAGVVEPGSTVSAEVDGLPTLTADVVR